MTKRGAFLSLVLCMLVALVLGGCSSARTAVVDSAVQEYPLHFDVSYDSNLLFAKYDVAIEVDGKLVGTVSQGDTFKQDVNLEEGDHTVGFHKADDAEVLAESSLDIADETYYSCTLKAHMDSIDIEDLSIETATARSNRARAEEEKAAREAEEKAKAEAAAQSALQAAELTVQTKYLEYADESLDPIKLVTCSDEDIDVSAGANIDLSRTGEQSVDYVLSCEGQQETRPITFTVRDTKKPVIKFHEKAITVEEDESCDLEDNIESVYDEVDEELDLVSKAPDSKGSKAGIDTFYDEGWYTLSGKVDTSTPGTYTIQVKAADVHGNVAKKSFKVKVVEYEDDEDEDYYDDEDDDDDDAVATSSVKTSASKKSSSKSSKKSSSKSSKKKAKEPKYTYIANVSTNKFHVPGCRAVSSMKESNKRTYEATRKEMQNMGYSPCGICSP